MFCNIYNKILRRFIAGFLALMLAFPSPYLYAQSVVLPPAGDKVGLSQAFQPAVLTALSVDPKDPLQFEFYMDPGQVDQGKDRQEEYLLLVKDFMTALTVPEEQLWVNLSPYEKDRIIDDRFGLTEAGRDLLAQDYILKQITASLIYPEEGIGKDFWAEVYRRAEDEYGTTDIPVDTFNKVWIMPDVAEVYQQGMNAMVLKAHLKVMLESDYTAMSNQPLPVADPGAGAPASSEFAKQAMRQIIVPVLEKEVNQGRHFARLRQIYNALILAAWYKKTMRETFLGKTYVDQSKVKGIEQADAGENVRIYNQYVAAFRKGVFNYVKEEIDRYSGEVIPRKYLSGGFTTGKDFAQKTLVVRTTIDAAEKSGLARRHEKVDVTFSTLNVGMDNITPASGNNDLYRALNIDRIKEIAHKIYEIKQASNNDFRRVIGNQDFLRFEREQKFLVKAAFKRMIKGQANEDTLIDIFNSFLGSESRTGLNSLVLSGEYTMDVFNQFMGLALFSREYVEDVPVDQVLNLVGLEPALFDQFRRIFRIFKQNTGFANGFYRSMVKNTVGLTKSGETFMPTRSNIDAIMKEGGPVLEGNIFFSPEVDDLDDLIKLRNADPEFSYIGASGRVAWVKRMVRTAERLLPKVYNRAVKLSGGLKDQERNLVYLRVKSEESLNNKIVLSGRGAESLTDITGARIAVRSLMELEVLDRKMREASIPLSRYLQEMKAQEMGLSQRKGPANAGKLKELRQQRDNLVHPDKEILIRSSNFFQGSERIPWYLAIHKVFANGDSLWAEENQFKILDLAILHDIEHKLQYSVQKSNGKAEMNRDIYAQLMMYIWLQNAVKLINYVYAKDPGMAMDFLASMQEESDKAQQVPVKDVFMEAGRSYGGIDVRNVDDALQVKGDRSGFSLEGLNRDPGGVDGFSPRILAVSPVEGLPFLKDIPLPQGVFSRN